MGRVRFVQPKTVRIPLTDGDFIDIKAELTAGEERESFAFMTATLEAGKAPLLAADRVELASLVAYIVGWSFTDATGQPVDVSESAMRALDSSTFSELYKAIAKHEETMAAQKKTTSGGSNGSSPTSI